MKKENKTINKHFRCSAEDARLLELAAKKTGMKESEYLRAMITKAPSDYPEIREKLDLLIHEIHKIGVNVNQIAYACNVNPVFYNEDREKLMYYMQNCRKLLLEVVKYCNHKDDAHVFRKRK